AGRIERGERSDEAERTFAYRDEIERVRQHVERSTGDDDGHYRAGNDEGNLGHARGGSERDRGDGAGDQERPEAGRAAGARETDEERADRHARGERDGE